MTKMDDVAKLANVSTATVSRVLSKNPNVSLKTQRRVLEAVDILGYKPNRLASNFRKRSSKTVVVVLPDITNSFFSKIVQGLEEVAQSRGYHVLLGDTRNNVESERNFIDLVNQKFVDGMILATARLPKEEILAVSQEIPIVLACEYFDGFDIPTVTIDNVSAAREATQHLVNLGHRRIGFISGPLSIVLGRDRLKGYRQAMLINELPVEESLIQEGDFTVQAGYNAMMKLMASNHPPSAIFAASDEMAIGAMKAARNKGLNVPEDVSIIGFDDIPAGTYVHPELTTIRQPAFEIGTQAMNLLLDMIKGCAKERKQLVLPHQVVLRETTTSPRG
ncbi:LacI family transcriptional regulator [Alicyclobacillus fastidiosus]|uniref:LacI family transcriptional regulator n=1 Tax=Alicyclobacillus fastidiosus TaxID=392011 RepID=A0ABY6ZII2_9BACL|nr:LacI family DNA-binding transcriptional regulator [Alicyclobacillus fastidiosus]WAH42692.1 LacI family transcriptional regulator [Alicyclobacillus fastidiosus]GMA64579.1 DNA-binding transcriptional regulator CytR [Alicyclobacillus fastidiosus]